MSPSTPAVSGRTPTPPFVAAQQPHGGGRNGAGTRASVLGSGWIRALATIGPALLVLLVAAFAFRAIDDTAARREQVVRSYRVELALEQLVERLRHAESAHRGYLLTGQAAYRARTEGALADLWAVHRQLGGLVSDDAQHRRLAALVPAVQARVAFMDSAVRVYDARGEEAAEALIASGRGQVLGDVVRRQVMAMHGAQETLLAARRDAERAADRRTLVVLGAGLGLAALLATLTNVLFVRHARSLAERTAAAEAGERWLRTTLESIGEGFLLLDRQWRVAYANPQVHAMLRLEAGLTGQSVWDALPASLGREHRSAYERAASAGEAIAFAAHFAPLERWFDVRAYPTPDGLAVYVDDVTESRRAESALRESEARLAGVIGSAMDTIITTDSAQRIVLFNAAAERAFGVSAHEAIGAPLDRFIPSRYRGRHHAHVEEYGATGVTTRAMGRALATSAAGLPASGASAPGAAHGPGAVLALRADGTEFPIEAAISQVETRGGRFFTVILRDVTERLRAEAALRATEEWLRFLAAASNALAGSATTAISFDEVARLAVPLLADACAIDVIDATGRSDRVAAHAVDGMGTLATGVLDAAVAGALREGRPQCLAAVDDAWRAVAPGAASLLLVPLVAEAAALDEARAAGTERGRGEGAAPVPAGEARREGVPHPGVPPAGAPQADAPQADAPDEPAARDAPSSGAARVLGLLALARTARRAPFADEDVERGTELARRVTVALERLRLHREALAGRAAAEHANRAKSQFMATMSHELRTPLNAITGYTELMELGVAGPTSEQQLAYLGRVRASAKHLLGLINEVLDLAKVEAGRVTVARAPLDVGAATEEALTLVRPQAAARRLTLDTAACTGAMAAVGDAGRVRQILVNLLSNAVKFTEPNGRITLTCGVRAEPVAGVPLPGRGPWAYVRVTDTGIGIPGDKLESVFEPFVQVDGAYTRQHGGTGLGLAISRRLARLMHGDLTLESRVGQGSTFTLWLPTVPLYRVAGRLTPASGLRVVSRTVPARSADIRELLHASVPLVLRRFVERLRADPLTAESRGAPDVEVEHHVAAFVAQLGQEIAILDARDADRSALIRDGSAIQAVIMQRRAAQRRRLGWTEAAVRREYTILGEELEAALRLGSAPAGQGPGGAGDPALEDAVALVRAFVQEACRAGVRAFRDAEPAPDADARSGEAAVPGERGSGAGETPSVPAHAPAEGSR